MTHRDVVVAQAQRVFGNHLSEVEERLSTIDEAELPQEPGPKLTAIESPPHGELPGQAVVASVERAAGAKRWKILLEGTTGLEKVIEGREDELTAREQVLLKAIIVLEGRSPLFVQAGDSVQTPAEWQVLNGHRARIKVSIARVGRVELAGHPDCAWIGTDFHAGPARS